MNDYSFYDSTLKRPLPAVPPETVQVRVGNAMWYGRLLIALINGLALIALPVMPGAALAQAYPAKAIRIIVPAVPGGGTDILARLLSPRLTEHLGQSIIVDNRAGASTNIGTELVARSAPDGYTVLIATTPHAVNPSLFRKLNFDPIKDFTMISQLESILPISIPLCVRTLFMASPAIMVNFISSMAFSRDSLVRSSTGPLGLTIKCPPSSRET